MLTGSVAGTTNHQIDTITVNPDPIISGTPPAGVVGLTYSTTLIAVPGTAPMKWSIVSGSVPPGLTFDTTSGKIAGTPTIPGTSSITVQLTDSSDIPFSVTAVETITITAAPLPLVVLAGNPPLGTVGLAYGTTIHASGGVLPYSWSLASGSLPPGLTLSASTGVISGIPTLPGTFVFTAQVQDAVGTRATGVFTITISPAPLGLTTGTLPTGTVGVPYNATVAVSGGTGPYSCSLTGPLQAGLSINACNVSGTPTVSGTVSLVVKASDSSNPTLITTGTVGLTINPAPLVITTSTLPNGTVGIPYSATIGVSGGTAPYTCSLTGPLQAGLSITACTVSGTPTAAGTVSLNVKAYDSSSPILTTNGPVGLTINPAPLVITTTTLPNGTVGIPYNATIAVTGGTAPYLCTLTGALQAGLSITGCTVSGTPTVSGTVSLNVKASDSSNPTLTTTGIVGLTINPAPLVITTTTLPNGTVGIPYNATIAVTGGTAPYTCTLTGPLQAGLSITGCTVSGTPTVSGTVSLNVKASDSSNPTLTTTGIVGLTINPAPLVITTSTLPNGTVGIPYNATIAVTGGTAPYTCTLTGPLQAGLSITGCTVSGTPTVSGTVSLNVKASDSSNPTLTTTGIVGLTINPAPLVLVIASPPPATVGVPYTGPISVTGGTGPYTCVLTGGTLPAGLTISNCTISGTPTTPGTTTVTITATDSSSPTITTTGPVTIVVNPATPTLTITSPPDATVGTPYTGPIGVTGGTAPYTCTLVSGTLPPGLTINNCTITGTPTTPGKTIVTITATDSGNPIATTTAPITINVLPVPPLTFTGSLPNATLNVPYTQTLAAAGGIAPYTYTITAGTLPPGITMSSTGVVSGTPTVVGASSFTVTATDSEGTPQTASLPLVLLVVYPTTPNDPELKGPYAFLFQGYDDEVAGALSYQTATVGSFTADGTGVLTSGELDSNHQSSNPTGTTIATNELLGTYTIGTDNRGTLAITTLNADGTVAGTATYAITLKAPVAPSTISVQADFIESDSNQLQGTKGSGTLLAQDATSYTAGLTGSYVFGLSGETPCLPACTIGISAGPVASVGVFSTDGAGNLTAGTSDENIASTKYPNQALTGSYTAADGNGRLQLTMPTAGAPAGVYPSDYAVYVVSANRAFILSNDKHSSYVLLGGSAQKQTQTSFTNLSMTGPYIGYENSPTNPGLIGVTLQNVLNLSSATIFRGVGDGAGNCNTTSVDTGGLTQLANGLTGLGSGVPILNALLGSYASTGNSACTVAGNGRVVLNYPAPSGLLPGILALLGLPDVPPPARVAYLASPNQGYFLETGYAGLGNLEAQTGAPFTLANTFTGTYVYGSAPASTVASIDSAGFIQSNGDGTATSTLDLNIGVGTINVLQLGVTTPSTYTAPDSTTGRFTLNGTTVVYAINHNRYVLVDENPLTTSPSVTVLY
nr:putative Ig domain-containing protein [Granulicella tundricola]